MEKIRIWDKNSRIRNIVEHPDKTCRTDPNTLLCCLMADIAEPLVSGTSTLAKLVFSVYLKDRYNKTKASI
jgi:hypothetical protein